MDIRISSIKVSPSFGEIDGDGGYFSMRNINKSYEQYLEEMAIENRKYLKDKQQLAKIDKINKLQELIQNPKTNIFKKVLYYIKQTLIKL